MHRYCKHWHSLDNGRVDGAVNMPRGRLPPLLVVVLLVATTQKSVRDASAATFQQFTSYGKAKTISVVNWQRPTSQYCTHTVVTP